jgi:hypothetical protein
LHSFFVKYYHPETKNQNINSKNTGKRLVCGIFLSPVICAFESEGGRE